VPEAKVIFADTSSEIPFRNNYFSITAGLMFTLVVGLIMFYFDFERENWYQPFRTVAIFGFIGSAMTYFVS